MPSVPPLVFSEQPVQLKSSKTRSRAALLKSHSVMNSVDNKLAVITNRTSFAEQTAQSAPSENVAVAYGTGGAGEPPLKMKLTLKVNVLACAGTVPIISTNAATTTAARYMLSFLAPMISLLLLLLLILGRSVSRRGSARTVITCLSLRFIEGASQLKSVPNTNVPV